MLGKFGSKNTRTDICFALNTLIRYMIEPKHVHLIMEKHVMRYLKGTIDYRFRYISDREIRPQGYTDSDWEGNVTDRKSTSGCCFGLGSAMISWFNRKQNRVELGTTEAKYIAVKQCGFKRCLQDCLISS